MLVITKPSFQFIFQELSDIINSNTLKEYETNDHSLLIKDVRTGKCVGRFYGNSKHGDFIDEFHVLDDPHKVTQDFESVLIAQNVPYSID